VIVECDDLPVAPATAGPARANASAAPAKTITILRINTLLVPGTRDVSRVRKGVRQRAVLRFDSQLLALAAMTPSEHFEMYQN
jgi:hypothetical protein